MSPTAGAQPWVGIVDDDETIRRALARLLRVYGIEAQTFSSAQDYLCRAQGAPACLCVDLYLRDEMNGLELVERIRAQGISPPIILFSGQDKRELESMVKNRHRGVVLRKPLDAQRLLDFVFEHLRPALSSRISG